MQRTPSAPKLPHAGCAATAPSELRAKLAWPRRWIRRSGRGVAAGKRHMVPLLHPGDGLTVDGLQGPLPATLPGFYYATSLSREI